MSDPYLVYDKSNVHVKVFRVKGPLKGDTEKDKLLHNEGYLFDPESGPINGFKIVKDKIYLSDTSEIILQKIAKNCCSGLSGKDIFAWIDEQPIKKSLLYTRPIGIRYNELEEYINPKPGKQNSANPFLDKKIDERFVNIDGSVKRNSKNLSDPYTIYNSLVANSLVANNVYHIYFATIEDVKEYSKSFDSDESLLKNGYLKKFFPYYDDPISDKIDKKIAMITFQKSLQKDFIEIPLVRPITLIYHNKPRGLLLDIFKIFREFTVTDEFPYLRIQTDNYMDSYVKLYKELINSGFVSDSKKTLTKEIFVKWNRNIYLEDKFTRPRGIDKTNSLSFVIYDSKSTNYVTMVLAIDGSVKLYCEKMMRLGKFTEDIMKKFIRRANELIDKIGETIIKPIIKIKDNPSRIDMSFIYEIPDYHIGSLSKLFQSLNTEFLMISNDEDQIHLLYHGDNYENPKYLTDFITLCKKKSLEDNAILKLLEQRYGLDRTKAKDHYDEWIRINMNNSMKISDDLQNISVIVEKVLDRINVSLFNLTTIGQMHECVNTINFIMGVYKEKRINKNKSFPDEINQLFKVNQIKNIVTSAPINPLDNRIDLDNQEYLQVQETSLEPNTDQEVNDDESEDDESSDDESSDDEYEWMVDSDSSQAGGKAEGKAGGKAGGKAEDESSYPNSRYHVKRLEQRDPRLISYKTKQGKSGYAYKCQASHDKQPISLTSSELKEIDHKTGFKNEGKSYSKAVRVEGGDRPDIYYICPKFWDRKNQIPLDPQEKYHPIELDENGEKKVEYRQFVWSKEMKGDNGDRYILERSGRPANRPDSDSYWNKDLKKKDDIKFYNVQYIHDDVHPELLPLPCCGKKPVQITSKNVSVIQKTNGKSKWATGQIISEINSKDEYLISVNGKEDYYHLSMIKQNKGTKVRLTTDFPLKENTNGHVSDIIKDMFHINIDAPFIRDRSGSKSKMIENGFFRKGVIQDSDAFLRCLDMIHCLNINNPNILKRSYSDFKLKDYLVRDLDMLTNDEIFSIGSGAFVQYFRGENKFSMKNYNKELIGEVKQNFINYLESNEPNDEKLLIPLLMKISEKNNNLSFGGIRINILILCEENEKIKIIEPYGKLQIFKNEPYALIYKNGDNYESLVYYYNNYAYGYLIAESDNSVINKNDVIYIQNDLVEPAEVVKKTKDKLTIQYIGKDIISEIENNDLLKYDMKCIVGILQDFILDCQTTVVNNKKELICEDDINFILTERFNFKIMNGYYDTYHKLVACTYKQNNSSFEIPVFFKPRSKTGVSYPLNPIKDIGKYKLFKVLKIYKKIDELVQEMYPDRYLSYLDDTTKIMIDDNNLMIGLLTNGFIVPLLSYKYDENKYKYEIITNSSLLSIQNDHLNCDINKDDSDDYFEDYNLQLKNKYDKFTSIYNEIMTNKDMKRSINKILDHPIKLLIHKRRDLLKLLEENKVTKSGDKGLKITKTFIEYLCIHDIEDLHKILFVNYASMKDYKANSYSDEFIILSMKEILTESYDDLFTKKSDFIRPISYYEETNPNIKTILLKKEFIEKPVSYYTKYPNLLKKIFTSDLKIHKNILDSDRNDINIISNLLMNIRTDLNDTYLRNILTDEYTDNDDSYKEQNKFLGKIYSNNLEFLSEVKKKDYHLSLVDYKLLSEKLEIGFVIFTNRYTNNDNKFHTYIIIHKNLLQDKKLTMMCLYEDFSDVDTDNKECKPIAINDNLIHELSVLRKSKEMNRIFKITYPKIENLD